MKNNKGFTLIELLITTALTVLLMLGITSLFMTLLVGNSKTNVRKTVKEEGVHALGQMEFLLKNAYYIDESTNPCASGMTQIDIVSLDGGISRLGTITVDSDSKIASDSASNFGNDSIALTSDSVTFATPLTFDCSGPVGNRQVKINFTLSKVTLEDPDTPVTESFNATVSIRN